MFGSTQQPPTSAPLGRSASFSFSQPPANKPFGGSTGTFSFGQPSSTVASTSNATSGQPQPSTATTATGAGGLFQTNTQNQPSTSTSGFSFGSTAPTQNTTGGGLFGSTSNNTTGTGGGLFGSSTTQPSAQGGGGLFGSSTAGLFGSSTATKPAGGFSFGGAPQASTLGGGGGLFGSSTSSQPAAGAGGLFGQSQSSFAPAQSQFGAQPQNQAAVSPFFRFGYYQKERFNDLPEEARKLVEELEKHISSQVQIKDELKTKDFGQEIRKGAAEWQELDSALKSLSATLEQDANLSRDVAERVEKDRADNATLYAIAQNAREGRSDGSGFVEWLQRYYAKLADEFRSRIQRYRSTMEQIERHLASLDHRDQYTPQAISDVIHAQHSSFMALATQVASLHSEVETLKKDYSRWYQQQHRSFRDPFGSMNQLASSVPP
ncbi:hypothetical protein IE53DRAFT_323719 [Violaceomyces palustris]|uniref:Uncharacterized protein n=1 Tax=Violaceomyces palustris TaxID=1673888 RepID=A0ACD0P7U0_9BASI|nr:hypothetical protein IE53DRAFT_323719 [Violaceomyces palustris]